MKAKSDIQKWAERMRKVGEFKERERKKWLQNSTLEERIKVTEELLSFCDAFPKKPIPEPSFVSLSFQLAKSKHRNDRR